jgi:hypothetical protein
MRSSAPNLALTPLLVLVLAACQNSPPPPTASTASFSPDQPPAIGALSPDPPRAQGAAGEGWNAAAIQWQPYEAGLARAKAENKPVCLVLYTDWCPHCKNYSHIFDDPRIVEQAKRFVMIRVNADAEDAVSRKHAVDGTYVPRTYFLAPDGAPQPEIRAARDRYIYFYDERDPAALLAGMNSALKKLGKG